MALKSRYPDVRVHTVEPDGFDDTARSIASGSRQRIDPDARSICDALQAPTPGSLTFQINAALTGPGLAVSDEEVGTAMRFAFRNLKLVVEPGGAVALAAVLCGRYPDDGGVSVVVISGGNVDFELFARIQVAG